MFRKKTKVANNGPEKIVEEAKAPSSRIDFIGEFTTHRGRELGAYLTDIDSSDLTAIKILYKGEWQTLQKYRTRAVIEFSDMTFRGGWIPMLPRSANEPNWFEALEGSAHINLGYSDRLYSFFDWDKPEGRPGTGARFSFYEARFDETSIAINSDFEEQWRAKEENRSFEERYIGSPVRYFATAMEADEFIDLEIMPFSGHRNLYKEQIERRTGKPQQYHWPNIALTNRKRFHMEAKHEGFYYPTILVPEDVYQGLRRSIADFSRGLRLSVVADLELLGIGILDPHPAPGHPIAELSIVPRSAQLTGRIKEVKIQWDGDETPFNNPSRIWTDED